MGKGTKQLIVASAVLGITAGAVIVASLSSKEVRAQVESGTKKIIQLGSYALDKFTDLMVAKTNDSVDYDQKDPWSRMTAVQDK